MVFFKVSTLLLGAGIISTAAACSSSKGGGPTDAGVIGNDAAVDAATPDPGACPTEAPVTGSACSDDIVCEYGSDPVFPCKTIAVCRSKTWTVTPPITTGGNCPSVTTCGSASKPNSTPSCTPGQWCHAPDGNCECEEGPVPGAPPLWSCSKPDPGCPATRPISGTPCPYETPDDAEGARCGASDCISMACIKKRWQPEPGTLCAQPYGF